MPCRGGYHPPVRLCNRRLRGARRLGAPSAGATCGRPLIEDAPPRGAGLPGRGTAFFPKESGGKERAGGLRPPWPPQYGGSWRRWAVRTGQRPGRHCRPSYWQLRHRRCRAPVSTHRDYPASPESCCAVPAWPAGPPSVPCIRKTLAGMVVIRRGDLWSPAAQASAGRLRPPQNQRVSRTNQETSCPSRMRKVFPSPRRFSPTSSQQVMNTCPPVMRRRTNSCRR